MSSTKKQNPILQVDDDCALLEKLWEAQKDADPLYKPGNYWETYAQVFLPELQTKGLKNFRRRHPSILSSFDATDLSIYRIHDKPSVIKQIEKTRFIWRFADKVLNALEMALLPIRNLFSRQFSAQNICDYHYPRIHAKFQKQGFDLKNFSVSLIGNPEEIVEYEDKLWSRSHLQMANVFIDVIEKVPNIKKDMTFMEIGPGLGRNAEHVATAYPDATIVLFDIVPQIYVLNQYMKKRFPDRFISCEESKNISDFSEHKGKILLFPTWRLPDLRHNQIDLFWNSASFQEMEPSIVENYLNIIQDMKPDHIYINAMPGGNYWGEWKPGQGGTKEPVKEEIYLRILENRYKLTHEYYTDYFLRPQDHKSYIFERTT